MNKSQKLLHIMNEGYYHANELTAPFSQFIEDATNPTLYDEDEADRNRDIMMEIASFAKNNGLGNIPDLVIMSIDDIVDDALEDNGRLMPNSESVSIKNYLGTKFIVISDKNAVLTNKIDSEKLLDLSNL